MESRVQKLMAMANVGSRRTAEELIAQGRVTVNGKVISVGAKADPDKDVIAVDGERIRFDKLPSIYLAVYKPKNVVTTHEPHEADTRRTVMDLVPNAEHLFPIGRLDADSEGLLVLTNDGDLANRLTHPRYRHTKTYLVTVAGEPSKGTLDRWQRGIMLDGEQTAPCVVRIIHSDKNETQLRIIMTEGKKRQIRRVANAMGHPVQRLIRTEIGMLSVEGIKPGEYRSLSEADIELLSTPSPEFRLPPRGRERRMRDEHQDRGPRNARAAGAAGAVGIAGARRAYSDRPPRREGDSSDRPRRPFGDRPPRREGDSSDRPRRPYGDRPPRRESDSSDRPRRSFGDRPPRRESDSSDRPRRSFGDRPPRREGDASDRPRRSSGDRPPRREGDSSDRPRRPYGDRPPRREGNSSDRPRRPYGDRPPRRDGGTGDRPQSTKRPPTGPRSEQRPSRDRDDTE